MNGTVTQLLTKAQTEGVQKLVVGAVIKQQGRFLLLQRDAADFMGGLVELPSGTVDAGEELLPALVRETREETGLETSSVLDYLGSFDYLSGSGKKSRQFNFLVEVVLGNVRLNPTEHQKYYFVGPTDAEFAKLNISDAVRAILKIA